MAHRGDGLSDIFEHNIIIRETCTANKFIGSWGIPIVSSNPASATEGTLILNSSTNSIYVYYSGDWRLLHTITIADDFLLLENGDYILLENGDKIILE